MSHSIKLKSISENPDFPGVKDVSPNEVLEQADNLKLIDVRRPDEYNGELGHVKNAELLTLDFLPQKIQSLPQDQCIVFICRSGRRSAQAAEFAHEHGFKQAYNMLGGMLLWNKKNFPVEAES